MKNMIQIFKRYLDYISVIVSVIIAFCMPDRTKYLPILGILIAVVTIKCCLETKKESILLMIFVIAIANISLAYSDCIKNGLYVIPWQIPLRETKYSVIMAKCILISICLLTCFIKRINASGMFHPERKYNVIISYSGYCFLWYILLTGIGQEIKNSSSYISNSNTLYEYAIVITLMVWYYGNSKIFDNLIKIYGVCFILQSFRFGDRSAGALMLLLICILYFKVKINFPKMIIGAIIGIIVLNFFIVYRVDRNQGFKEIAEKTIDRGIYLDTVSYCYYAGMTVCALHDYEENKLHMIGEFIKATIEGSSRNEYAEISDYVTKHYPFIRNKGGGMYSSLFYCWGGYMGVILGNLVVGIIILFLFNAKNSMAQMQGILFIVYTFRWYIYNVFNIFRTILVVFSALYVLCRVFDMIVSRKRRIYFVKR